MKKVVSLLLVVTMLLSFGMTFATTVDWPGIGSAPTGIDTGVKNILGAIQFIGYAFAIGMLIVLGIKYVMASAQEKADLKKGMISYVIGAVLIAGAATLPKLIAEAIKF